MPPFLARLRQHLSKPLLFGLYGAVGCFLAALLLGEIFLFLTQQPFTISGSQLVESGNAGDYRLIYAVLRVGGWTALLAFGTSLALITGQNHYLHRRLLTPRQGTIGTVGGLAAGLVAGSLGQLIFMPAAGIPILSIVGRIIAWTSLGTLVGGGMSFFVPNLKLQRGFLGGAIGGSVGAIAFLIAATNIGDFAGRLVGTTVLGFFIGLMIAWIEQISREAWVVVHWTPLEKTTISLGDSPIILGSSEAAHIYLRKDKGFPPVTAQIYREKDKIIMEFNQVMKELKSMKILKQELKDGDKRKLGDVLLEVQTASVKLKSTTPN